MSDNYNLHNLSAVERKTFFKSIIKVYLHCSCVNVVGDPKLIKNTLLDKSGNPESLKK